MLLEQKNVVALEGTMVVLEEKKVETLKYIQANLNPSSIHESKFNIYMCDCTGCSSGCNDSCSDTAEDDHGCLYSVTH